MKNNKLHTYSLPIKISRLATRLLNAFLPFLILFFIWFLVSYISAHQQNPILADELYRVIADHLFLSLALVLGGAAILDCSVANGDINDIDKR